MAEDKDKTQNATPAGAPETAGSRFSLPILPILNIVALLGTAGFAVYSKLLFKRPPILESVEREKVIALHSTPTPGTNPASIKFGPLTSNIAANTEHMHHPPGEKPTAHAEGKLHFVTLSFSMNISDESQQDLVEAIRPIFMDRLNQILGKKQFHELISVQGRYLLQSQLIDVANQLIQTSSANAPKEGIVTAIYFTQFIVQ